MRKRYTLLFSTMILLILSGLITSSANAQAAGGGKKEEASVGGGGFQFKMIVGRNDNAANNKAENKTLSSKNKLSAKNSKSNVKNKSKISKVPRVTDEEKEDIEVGKIISLPKPDYPKAASAVNASGLVEVLVTIDEEGNVINAEATNGHPLLKAAAIDAAKKAKFTPTLLNKQPVKVTGVISYNFTK